MVVQGWYKGGGLSCRWGGTRDGTRVGIGGGY